MPKVDKGNNDVLESRCPFDYIASLSLKASLTAVPKASLMIEGLIQVSLWRHLWRSGERERAGSAARLCAGEIPNLCWDVAWVHG